MKADRGAAESRKLSKKAQAKAVAEAEAAAAPPPEVEEAPAPVEAEVESLGGRGGRRRGGGPEVAEEAGRGDRGRAEEAPAEASEAPDERLAEEATTES